jgi:4-hydroxybenzoate polyprenyltransferase
VIRELLTVSRVNIQAASLPTATLGILLASSSGTDVLNGASLFYVLFFFVVLSYSCQVNCLHDVEGDDRSKPHFSRSVRAIGIRRLKIITVIELAVAAGLVLAIVWLKKDAIYLLLTLGIGIGHAYSAPPLKIKKRGVCSPLPVIFGLYFLPIAAGGFLVLDKITGTILLFALGYALVMEGITMVNTCEDFVEDQASGIRTLAHVIGIRRALGVGAVLVASGGLIVVAALFSRILSLAHETILLGATFLFGAAFLTAVYRISRSLFLLSRRPDPIQGSKCLARNMPLWFMWTRYPLLAIALILAFVASYSRIS